MEVGMITVKTEEGKKEAEVEMGYQIHKITNAHTSTYISSFINF